MSFLFLYLISSFLSDQIEAIKLNQSTVESMKDQFGKPDTFFNQLAIVFGDNQFYWFLPTKPKYNCNYLELLYKQEHMIVIQQTNTEYLEDKINDKQHELYQYFRRYKVI